VKNHQEGRRSQPSEERSFPRHREVDPGNWTGS
jgi:hypothetical protein